MKRILSFLFALSAISLTNAQTVQIGTGTLIPGNTLYSPVYRFSATSTTTHARSNILFTAAEMAAAGIPAGATITAVEFNKTNADNFTSPITQTMLMANTSNTSLATTLTWASVLSTHTQVFQDNAFNLPATSGWVTWTITPFVYTGGALEIATEHQMPGNGGATGPFQWEYTAGTANMIVGAWGTSFPTTLNGTVANYKHRPNIRITYFTGPCTDPPTPGDATATPNSNVCPGSAVALNLVNNSSGSGQTYQWQSSPNNTTYTNFGSSQLGPALVVNPTSSVWYRCAVTCGTSTMYSTPVQVNVLPGLSGNYTINSAVVTGGTNFQSFNDFASALSCGVSGPVIADVVVGSGPYNEQVTFTQVSGASSVNTITINGNGETLTYSSNVSAERAGIKLDGADYFDINNLAITATGTYGYCIHLLSGSSNNTIDSCVLTTSTTSTSSTNYAGIVASGSATSMTTVGSDCDSNTFSNNTVIGGYYGIKLMGNGTTDRFIYNRVLNNDVQDFYIYGIHLDGHDYGLVQGNDISRPTRTSVSTFYGVYFTDVINGRINRNRIHNPMGAALTSTSAVYGVYFTTNDATSADANVVSNNAIYDINNNGIIYGIYNSGSDYARYYHNTISLDETGSTSTGVTRAFYQTTLATGIEFVNNIITISRGGTGTKHAIYLNTSGTSPVSNRNVIYITSTGGTNNVAYEAGTDYATLGDWQAIGYDIGSQAVDPIYTNMGNGDFTPQEAAINALGLPVGILSDINGAPRNVSTPDPGAFEFGLPPCTEPPTAGDATASPATVCAGQLVALNLQNNSAGDGQTYQWQLSTDGVNYSNFGSSSTASNTNNTPSVTTWYRAAVTCGATTVYSTPIQVLVTPGISGNYTINSALVTGGTNFQTFNDFAAALACGVTGPVVVSVVAGSGPYNEQVTFPEIMGVSATNTITINGNGETLTYASTNTNDRAGIRLDGADYFRINNLVVEATGTYGFAIQILSFSNNNIINGCTVNLPMTSTSTNYQGILVNGSYSSYTTVGVDCDSNIISNNTVNGGYTGIRLLGNGVNDRHMHNQVINNNVHDFYSYGIYMDSQDSILCEGNDVARPTRTGVTTTYCIYGTELQKARINANRIHNPMDMIQTSTSTVYGIYFTTNDATAGNENVVSNNAIYSINNNGAIYGIYNSSSDYARYYHNTISLDEAGSTATGVTRAIYQITSATGIEIYNNIITISRGGTGAKHGIYLATSTSTVTSDHNNIYISATGGTNSVGYSGSDQVTLANWQAAGYDANGASEDPMYQNIGLGDLTPTNINLDNLGMPVGIMSDILSSARSATNPDMGAWEFLTVPCADPTGLAAANITNSSADLSWDNINFIPGFEYVVDQNPGPPSGNGTFTTNNFYNATGLMQSTQYYLHVRVFCGNGNYSQWVTLPFETSCPNAVAVVSYTGPTTFCEGDSLVLSAQTDPNYTYQWRMNGADIPGATDSTYAVTMSGNYAVKVTNGTGCTTTSLPLVAITVNPAPPAVITGNLSICYSGSVTLSANAGTGVTYQWQENGIDITGETNPNFTTSDSGSYTVVVTYTSTGCAATSAPADVVINAPAVVSANDSFNCGPGTVTLTGVPSTGATLNWYDVPGGTLLGTGNSFTTPFIGTTTTYYVTAGMGASVGAVGPLTPQSVGGGGGTNTTAYWMYFDVLQPTTLVSVDVFPTGTIGSNASINIEDNLGNVINSTPYVTTVTGGSTPQTVMINFPMAPGLQYRLRQGTSTALFRNTGGATFPYTSSAINITGHNFTTATYYYYFYNWQFTTGCESGAIPVVANINPIPNATATPTGPTNVCIGDLVTMDATPGMNYTYQWMNNGSPITGADSAQYIVNAGGNYSVIVAEGPCSDTSAAVAVNVNTPPASNIYPAGSTTICQGNTLQLNANTGTGLTYQWQLNGVDIAGATNQSYIANGAGDYTVTVSNGTTTNCSLTSPIVTVTVVPAPPAVITPAGPTSVCANEHVELNASTGLGLSYQWQESGVNIPGAFAETYYATVSGTYTVLVSNGACTIPSAPVNVTVFPALNPVATIAGNVLSTGAFAGYQWYQNGIMIPGATNQSFSAVGYADYFVVVTDVNGCKDTSNTIGYYPTAVNNVNGDEEISIYPNPTSSTVFIRAAVKVNAVVTSVDGKVVAEKKDATSIDLGEVAPGVYQIRVTDEENRLLKVEKILKTGK